MTAEHMAGFWDDLELDGAVVRRNVEPGAYRIVSVRLRQAEFETFSTQARALGFTHNLALRVAARRIAGFLEIDAETRTLLRRISGDIGEMSATLGQLNLLAAGGGTVDMEKLNQCRAGFGREFAALDDKLQTLLNVSKRRLDGRAMLKDASSG